MLSQQMQSCDSLKIETVDDQSPTDRLSNSTDTSSIALTNYNNQHKCILCHPSPIRLLIHNNEDSTLSSAFGRDVTLCHLIYCSPVEPFFSTTFEESATQLPSTNWICSYFGNFS